MRLRDTPIRRKLILMLMLVSVVVMLLMRGIFFTYELLALRRGVASPRALAAACLKLSDLLTSHMTREEAMFFPSARELMLAGSRS